MKMFYNVQKLLPPQSWVSMTARNSPWRLKRDKPSVTSSLHSVRTAIQPNSEDHYYGAIYDGYGSLFRKIINSWLITYRKSSLFWNCLHIFYQDMKINIFLKADFEILDDRGVSTINTNNKNIIKYQNKKKLETCEKNQTVTSP